MKDYIHKIFKFILSIGIIFSSITTSNIMSTIEADSKETVSVTKSSTYYYKSCDLGSWSTGHYSVEMKDGTSGLAFCIQPKNKTPGSGSYNISNMSLDSAVTKVLYYGWYIHTVSASKDSDDYFWKSHHSSYSDKKRYIIVHVAASLASGNSGWAQGANDTCQSVAKELVKFAKSSDRSGIPDKAGVYFQASGKKVSSAKAITSKTITEYFSRCSNYSDYENEFTTLLNEGAQFTNASSFRTYNEDSNFTITLPENVKAVVYTNNSAHTIQKITDYGDTIKYDGSHSGDLILSYILKADADLLADYTVTMKGSSVPSWQAYRLSKASSSSYQDLALMAYTKSSPSAYLNLIWSQYVPLRITKTDMYENGLEGAKFSLATSFDKDTATIKNVIETAISDENGECTFTSLEAEQTYYVEESEAPDNYLRDQDIYKVEVLSSGDMKVTNVVDDENIDDDDIEYSNGTINFVDYGQYGSIRVYKKDTKTDKNLSGAVYSITNTSTIDFNFDVPEGTFGNELEYSYTSGKFSYEFEIEQEGTVIDYLPVGTYVIKEVKAPAGYQKSDKQYTVSISYDASKAQEGKEIPEITVECDDERLTGSLTVKKLDLDSNESLSGAVFKLVNTDSVDDGNKTYGAGEYTVISDETDLNGIVVFDDLPLGNYVLTEIKAPEHYVLNTNSFNISVNDDGTGENIMLYETVKDEKIHGKIEIIKKDQDTKENVLQAGTAFEILSSDKKTVISTIETDDTGKAVSEDLDYGTYYVKEIKAPDGYTLNTDMFEVNISENNETYSVEVFNEKAYGNLNIVKQDAQTKNKAQGDATLKGAVYTLYAAEDIIDPASQKVIYEKDSIVKTVVTDDEGKAGIEQLPLGNYYLSETIAPVGYKLDKTVYKVSIQQSDDEKVIVKNLTVKDDVAVSKIKIIKMAGCGDKSYYDEYEEGIHFDIVLTEYVTKYGSVEKALEHKDEYSEQEYCSIVTDKNGEAVSGDLAYGNYTIHQSSSTNQTIDTDDFTYDVKAGETSVVYEIPIVNQKIKAHITVTKKDRTTNKNILTADTVYKVKANHNVTVGGIDFKAGEYIYEKTLTGKKDQWKVNSQGILEFDMLFSAGSYTLEEVSAPYGYTIGDSLTFTVQKDDNAKQDDDGNYYLDLVQYDDEVKGIINIEKKGEVLEGYSEGQFIYSEEGIDGAEFDIIALEDILDPSGDQSILYKKGSVVDSVKTVNGKASSKELPLGKYKVKETVVPEGYVKDDQEYTVELTYQDQSTSVVFASCAILNTRQKVKVNIDKIDQMTKKALAGATIGLYANEDIKNHDGKVIVNKDQQLSVLTTSSDTETFSIDLPLNYSFYIKEIEAPAGYFVDDDIFDFRTDYSDPDEEIITFEHTFKDAPTVTEISKYDLTGEKELEGATLQLWQDDTLLEQWISDGSSHIIYGLHQNEEYVLKETKAADGYVIANDIHFTINDQPVINTVSMIDKRVAVSKTDMTSGKLLKGAKLEITDKETGKVMDSWISEENVHYASNLKEGKTYILTEISAPAGYAISESVEFYVNEDKSLQKVEMKDAILQRVSTGDTSNLLPFIILGTGCLMVFGYLIFSKRKD